MSARIDTDRLAAFAPRRETLFWGTLLVSAEAAALAAYLSIADVTAIAVLPYLYPFVWLNASFWALARVDFPAASGRRRLLAVSVGVAYFLVLALVGGLLRLDGMGAGARIAWLPPGWGPALLYSGTSLTVIGMPYKVVGYATLAYLVAVTVADAAGSGSALRGVVGLFSCVSCTWPVLATVLTTLFGGASAAAAVATNQPYGLSTVIFLSAIGLLVWRPALGGRGDRGRERERKQERERG
jgi:hypothetical protein